MTSFLLKIIGIITMLFDHVGDSIVGKFSFFNLIGRISFPIFAFQTVEGYIHTKNFKKHILKMFIFACISQIPFSLFLSTFTQGNYLNIFFTVTLGLIALGLYDKCKNKFLGFLGVLLISILGYFIKVDYSYFGILLIFLFYFFNQEKTNILFIKRHSKLLTIISTFLLSFIYYLPNIIKFPSLWQVYSLCTLFTCFSLFFILLYNKKEGPKLKYFFYIFYPLHLLILYFLHSIL